MLACLRDMRTEGDIPEPPGMHEGVEKSTRIKFRLNDSALAFAHVADAVRGKDTVDEATADRLLAELKARFTKPLS
jgi:hypothetical protein